MAAVRKITGGRGVDYVLECSGAVECAQRGLAYMVNRGGRICLAAFPHTSSGRRRALVRNNIYVYGVRGEGRSATHRAEAFMAQKRFDAARSIPIPSSSTSCRRRCAMRASASRTPSRWW